MDWVEAVGYGAEYSCISFGNNYVSDPTIIKESDDDVTIGSALVLSCGDNTIAADIYLWYFQELYISDQSSKILELENFTEDNIGMYKCRAVKSQYTTANASFVAIMKPTITRETSGTFYGAGGDYVLRCNSGSSATEGWTYTWTKSGNVDAGTTADSYTITNATAATHDGNYSCSSIYNGVSSTSNNLTITIIAATLIARDSVGEITTDTTYNVGADGPNLTCTTTPELENVDSSKHLRYDFWNGVASVQEGPLNTYTIYSGSENSATYNCSVTYDGTTTYSLPSSTVAFSNSYISDPVIYKQNPDELSIESTLVLSCGDETTEADIFQWTIKDKVPQYQQSQTFRVDNFSLDDIGVYKCRVIKSRYITAEASFVAIMKPTITREPSGIFYGAGCDYNLLCNSGSNESVGWTYLWAKDGENTSLQSDSYFLENSTAATNNGVYTCTSSYNGVSSTSNGLNITIVAAIVEVTDTTGPVTTDTVYNAGSDGPTLTCTTTEELADYDIKIPPVYEFSDGTEIIQTGPSNTYTLNIFVLSSASYNCSITFDGSTTFSPPTYNIEISDNYVPDPTLFKESADDFTIGIPLLLSCGNTTVDGDYYVWYFQDNPILDQSSKILRHDNFTEDDIGEYTCRAVKSRYTTANTSLVALMKPTITREPSGTFYGAGGDYILRCNSGSSFTTGWDFSWTKDGNLTISVSDSYTLENATADEYDGVYACTSSYNGVTRASDDLSITVVAASLVVDDLTGLITTDTTYNIGADGPTLTCITIPVLAFLSGAKAVEYDFSDGIKSIQKGTSNTFSINMFALSNTTYNCSVTYDGTSTFSSTSPTISVSKCV
ncbi:uncharacterized protein LOC131950381 [Physella acuta]|uniref:uncharacterized protein LOC131950381 n=1 Tax=Physella acuta TaxID=109671 RepID=UPI0027DC6ABA|nr:uncharacterized protein LOC131950381 [Physella acuta]